MAAIATWLPFMEPARLAALVGTVSLVAIVPVLLAACWIVFGRR